MIIINKQELSSLISFNEVFDKTKNAFVLFSQKKTITPPFTVFTIPQNNGSVHFKCGYVPNEKYFAMKYSGAFYGNEAKGLSNFLGLFTVFNAETGEVEAIIDDKGYLTDYRTGIAGSIATTTLANPNSKVVAMIGTGIQARMQLMALVNVMDINIIQVYGRNEKNAKIYIEEMQALYPKLNFKFCESVKEAVVNADIVYTVTYSEKPIINSDWIKPGTHITAIGACEPNMQELDENLLKKADIVCADSTEACLKNGELHHALDMGLINKKNIIELGTAISNKLKRKPTDITICDLVGVGFQDAIIACCVMNAYNIKNKQNNQTDFN